MSFPHSFHNSDEIRIVSLEENHNNQHRLNPAQLLALKVLICFLFPRRSWPIWATTRVFSAGEDAVPYGGYILGYMWRGSCGGIRAGRLLILRWTAVRWTLIGQTAAFWPQGAPGESMTVTQWEKWRTRRLLPNVPRAISQFFLIGKV